MTVDRGRRDASTLPPDDAFGVLGNEARMEILRTLAAADEPLSFTELHGRVGTRDSGQFNYHLGKLEGHFVRKSDRGYSLRQAGRRVIEAVLSGAVTEAVVMEPTRLDEPCPYCGADIEVSYREERLLVRCTECGGSFGEIESTSDAFEKLPKRTLTLYYLPSAGLQDRTPRDGTRCRARVDLHRKHCRRQWYLFAVCRIGRDIDRGLSRASDRRGDLQPLQ